MLPATAFAPAGEPPAGLLAGYAAHLHRTGRGNFGYHRAARGFLRDWPDSRDWTRLPRATRLTAGAQTRPFLVFLMVSGRLRPATTIWLPRKLASLWRGFG